MKNLFILFGIAFASLLVTLSSQTIIPNGTGGGGSSSSSSGGGAFSLANMNDYMLTRVDATHMRINNAATTTLGAVINGLLGTTSYQFTSMGEITISACGGNETQRWYRLAGTIHIRPSGTACTYTDTGTTAITIDTAGASFPTEGIDPLWVTTNTATSWDALTGTMDKRAPFGTDRLITASGCIAATTTATSTDLDGSACGGTPGGSTTQIQYNAAGVFAGDAGATYDATNDIATYGGATDFASIGKLTGGGYGALWFKVTPSGTNYAMIGDGVNILINAANAGGTIFHRINNADRFSLSNTLADFAVATKAPLWQTTTNCASAAAPAVCAAAAAGAVTVAAAATTVVVNTTAVTASSRIHVIQDDSLGTELSVTCYTAAQTAPRVSAKTAGVSFTITVTAPITNPGCYTYTIVN